MIAQTETRERTTHKTFFELFGSCTSLATEGPTPYGGSYEICPSGGFEFGVSDDDLGITYEEWRERWVGDGKPWNGIAIEPPFGWDPEEQLRKLLETME